MNQDTSMTGIEQELARLNLGNWMAVIRTLDDHFHGYVFEDEDQIPSNAIYAILQTLDRDDQPATRLVHRLCELDCFTYRCYYQDELNHAVYWNPLEQTHQSFEDQAAGKPKHYQIDAEHPAKDIIRTWLLERAKEQDR